MNSRVALALVVGLFATAGTWGAATTVNVCATALVCNGTEYFGVGLQQSGGVTDLQVFGTTSGTMTNLGTAESMSGEVWSAAAGSSGTAFHALWAQDEQPGGRGNRVIYARPY